MLAYLKSFLFSQEHKLPAHSFNTFSSEEKTFDAFVFDLTHRGISVCAPNVARVEFSLKNDKIVSLIAVPRGGGEAPLLMVQIDSGLITKSTLNASVLFATQDVRLYRGSNDSEIDIASFTLKAVSIPVGSQFAPAVQLVGEAIRDD